MFNLLYKLCIVYIDYICNLYILHGLHYIINYVYLQYWCILKTPTVSSIYLFSFFQYLLSFEYCVKLLVVKNRVDLITPDLSI